MGWEEEIPPIPSREQEIAFIEKLEEHYRAQPWYKLYMLEAPRRNKLQDSERINQYRKKWTFNFLLGLIISGAFMIPIGNTFQRNASGVPYYHRPKNIFYTPKVYNQSRKNRHMMIQFPLWIGLSLCYAHYFTDRSQYDDEYLERNKVVKML